MHDLGTLAGFSCATDINDDGWVVGYAHTADVDSLRAPNGYHHAFLYRDGVMEDLGTLPQGTVSSAEAVNNTGQIVGYADVSGKGLRLFLYDSTGMHDLGGLPDHPFTVPTSINDAGQVVGYAYIDSEYSSKAFLWHGGEFVDLQELLPPDTGWQLLQARGISSAGQIVGSGYHYGQYRGFLLSAVSV